MFPSLSDHHKAVDQQQLPPTREDMQRAMTALSNANENTFDNLMTQLLQLTACWLPAIEDQHHREDYIQEIGELIVGTYLHIADPYNNVRYDPAA